MRHNCFSKPQFCRFCFTRCSKIWFSCDDC